MTAHNPLLQPFDLPPYSAIRPEHVEPAVDAILAENRAAIAVLLAGQSDTPSWEGLVLAFDELNDRLGRAWSPVSHLNAVCNNAELRAAYEACLPKLSEYSTELGQNPVLFKAYAALADSPEAAGFEVAQRTLLEHALRDFRLSGIDLAPAEQQRYGAIQMKLSELGSRFSNQLLDATQAWTKQVTNEAMLGGLTDSAKAQMQQAAEAKGLDGWLITLEFPSYYAVMTYADDRALREEVYAAYCTRASDQGPNAGQHDNGPVMAEILDLRQELAQLLGFASFAELSLATKMADSPEQVLSFLRDLAVRSKPFAVQDLQELKAFAAEQGLHDLQSWDVGYYSEKLREQRYSISQETLRAYFPIDKVLGGLFAIVQKLYGIQIKELSDFDTWHPDVRLFEIEENGQHVGRFFFDLYARATPGFADRVEQAPRRRWPAGQPGGQSGVQLHSASRYCSGQRPPGAADPRRSDHPVPRVRPWPAPPTDPGRARRCIGHQWRGLGCRGAAEPVHGELVLGAGGPGVDRRPLRNRRAVAPGPAGQDAGGEELPLRADDGAPGGILPVRLRDARHPR